MLPAILTAHLQETLDLKVLSAAALGGGCIHQAHRVDTSVGALFVKWNRLDQAANFDAEEQGLALLRDTQTVPVPDLISRGSVGDLAYLALSFIGQAPRAADYWEVLGTRLARLHQHSAEHFGLAQDNFIGALPQSNRMHRNWCDFFINERLMPTLEGAIKRGHLAPALRKDMERLCRRLPHWLPEAPPALLHGDLWGGNLLPGPDGQAVIFDPAVYYGHREIELAFMTLFDSPPARFYQAYESVWPLQPGFEERIDLYHLYPLLVHVNLFGKSYTGSVLRILRQYR